MNNNNVTLLRITLLFYVLNSVNVVANMLRPWKKRREAHMELASKWVSMYCNTIDPYFCKGPISWTCLSLQISEEICSITFGTNGGRPVH